MLIKNCRLLLPQGPLAACRFQPGDIRFGSTITAIRRQDQADRFASSVWEGSETEPAIDGGGCYLTPGLIDLHLHGGRSWDCMSLDEEALPQLARCCVSRGVTSFCATLMSAPPEVLTRAVELVGRFCAAYSPAGAGHSNCGPCLGARCLGANLEGPWLSPTQPGAHDPAYFTLPDLELFHRLNRVGGGCLRLTTVAPELPGALDFIREISPGCIVSLGHSQADFHCAQAAFRAGASQVTHLFNYMPSLNHLEPGIFGAAHDANARVELICDGVKVHPAVVRLIFAIFPGRVCLSSDSRCSSASPDEPELVSLLWQGQGPPEPACDLLTGVKRAIRFGVPPEAALAAATSTPAQALGLSGQTGSLTPGANADLLLLDRDFNIKQVFIAGQALL